MLQVHIYINFVPYLCLSLHHVFLNIKHYTGICKSSKTMMCELTPLENERHAVQNSYNQSKIKCSILTLRAASASAWAENGETKLYTISPAIIQCEQIGKM
jgi:hypothetical protein